MEIRGMHLRTALARASMDVFKFGCEFSSMFVMKQMQSRGVSQEIAFPIKASWRK
jgi:hypothetical protein